jgi:hypothetical protein
MKSYKGSQPRLPLPKDPVKKTCALATAIITNWMESCREHPECNSHNFFAQSSGTQTSGKAAGDDTGKKGCNHFLPKRLIWLGENAEKVRLVPYPTQCEEYAALSYCWGGDGTFKTEGHVVEKFEKDIPLKHLPQTIRDAFCLTKRLGLEYLWIDAICIVQGKKDD